MIAVDARAATTFPENLPGQQRQQVLRYMESLLMPARENMQSTPARRKAVLQQLDIIFAPARLNTSQVSTPTFPTTYIAIEPDTPCDKDQHEKDEPPVFIDVATIDALFGGHRRESAGYYPKRF